VRDGCAFVLVAAGCCEGAEVVLDVALLVEGSAGGVRGCVEGAACDWPGDAISTWILCRRDAAAVEEYGEVRCWWMNERS
jgi:hypothetical protein